MRMRSFPIGKYGRWQQRGIWDGKYQENEVIGRIVYDDQSHDWLLSYAIKSDKGYIFPIYRNGAKVPSANGKWRKVPKVYYYFKRIESCE